MYRKALADLKDWQHHIGRKPLVIRGARQVGKTWLVREFARQNFDLLEINFDKTPDKSSLLQSGDIARCLQMLALDANMEIRPGKTLIFLDEIQAAPELLPLLRYFYEERPDIHIIAAGSLLEFLLDDHDFSMPVGRVEYLHLGPMVFEEFLLGLGQKNLLEFIAGFSLSDNIPESVHNHLLYYVKLFWVIGGMPAAVQAYSLSDDILNSVREHENILQTYEDDFGKYRKRIYPGRIRKIFSRLPNLIGKKLKYVNIDPLEKARDLAAGLHLLELAKIYYPVRHSSGNGVPLGAEAKERDFKPLFIDTGLVSTSLGLNLTSLEMVDELLLVNNGAIAEQFVGQHLLYRQKYYKKPELYYWNRAKKSSRAEVDYLVSIGDKVVPVEVKAGKTGSLKSLQVFIAEKKVNLAFRFCASPPSCGEFVTAISGKDKVKYRLVSLPLYLVGQTERLLAEASGGTQE